MAKFIRAALGIVFFIISVLIYQKAATNDGGMGLGISVVVISLIFALAAVFCLTPFVTSFFGNFAGRFFFPEAITELEEEFSQVRGLLANRQYEEAVERLREIIEERPELVTGKLMLVTTLYEKLDRRQEALDIALDELNRHADWDEAHGKIASVAVDILLAEHETERAIEVLRQAIERSGRSASTASLAKRLKHLTETS